jgi:parallel beta-helix repeat protein
VIPHNLVYYQTYTVLGQTILSDNSSYQTKLLFVNPNTGDDQAGDGSKKSPWKTITQALHLAPLNSVIMLAPGTYSANTGEIFPLMLKSGVGMQGDTQNQGGDVKIMGGGQYLTHSFGGENVAVVGANQSSISGVTISNTNDRGYGLWIESANTVVQNNTFTNNTQDGIAIAGDAAPSISRNYFYQNGANGLTISGDARPEVRANVFQRTGFGINIVDKAAPVIIANQIQENRSGIVLQANCHPTLRNNIIQDNQEDGLVIIAQATPDLGSPTDPGKNEFQRNARSDINTQAAKNMFAAANNYIDTGNHIDRIIGYSGSTSARTMDSLPTAPNSPAEAPLDGTNIHQSSQLPPSLSQPTVNYLKVASGTIEFDAPQASSPGSSNSSYSHTTRRFPRYYRVIVPITTVKQQKLIRSLYPKAFTANWQGHKVMQVGVFRTQNQARTIAKSLDHHGLRAMIEPRN